MVRTWTWNSSFSLSAGAVTVRATAPAVPPATNILRRRPKVKPLQHHSERQQAGVPDSICRPLPPLSCRRGWVAWGRGLLHGEAALSHRRNLLIETDQYTINAFAPSLAPMSLSNKKLLFKLRTGRGFQRPCFERGSVNVSQRSGFYLLWPQAPY